MKIGGRDFAEKGKTYVMGILNVTPDSFSDGGRFAAPEAACARALQMIRDGADIIDIGGESTRPGHTAVDAEEEMRRVLPAVREIRKITDIPISIDTSKAEVARAALEAGADMVNDVWGLKRDPEMAGVIAGYGAACCLMHNREKPVYERFAREVAEDMEASLAIADRAGIDRSRIILDPGIGFAKNTSQNLYLMNHPEVLSALGRPLLLGASRKSVIGYVLGIQGVPGIQSMPGMSCMPCMPGGPDISAVPGVSCLPPEEREEGTLAVTVAAVMKGYMFVRVHDVRANVRAVRMTEAIIRA